MTIPEKINGKKVTALGGMLFAYEQAKVSPIQVVAGTYGEKYAHLQAKYNGHDKPPTRVNEVI